VVICFSAMTSHTGQRGPVPLRRSVHSLFGLGVEQLDRQANALAAQGVEVVVIEPTAKDQAAMGANLMDAGRWRTVIEVALSSVAAQLRRRRVRTKLGALVTAA
jgi:hypothetical protein